MADIKTTVKASTAKRSPAEASVVMRKAGFSQRGVDLGYGLVLANTSRTNDALDVSISVNFLDTAGRVVATDSWTLTLIPARKTFYYGGETVVSKREHVARLKPRVAVGSSEPASHALPTVRRVRVTYVKPIGVRVRGEVENTLDSPLSRFAKIGVVIFDHKDKVVGGGFTFLDANLPAGKRARFDSGNGAGATPRAKAHHARASVENRTVKNR